MSLLTSEGEAGDTEPGWVTFVNPSTGRSLRLPAHTKEEEAGRWSGPGAWTAQDDLLDEQAQRIIAGISDRPFVAAQDRGAMWRRRRLQGWGPASLTLSGGHQSSAAPQLDSVVPALPALTAATRGPLGRHTTMTFPGPSKLPPPRPRVRAQWRNRLQGLYRGALLTFGLVTLMALLMGGD